MAWAAAFPLAIASAILGTTVSVLLEIVLWDWATVELACVLAVRRVVAMVACVAASVEATCVFMLSHFVIVYFFLLARPECST